MVGYKIGLLFHTGGNDTASTTRTNKSDNSRAKTTENGTLIKESPKISNRSPALDRKRQLVPSPLARREYSII